MSASTPKPRVLLPDNVSPVKYTLKLQPNLKTPFNIAGEEDIDVEVAKETSEVVMHVLEITVQSATVTVGGVTHETSNIAYDTALQTVSLHFASAIPVGPAKLHLTFTAVLNDKLCGFYRSSYKVGQEQRYMGATQFEAPDARRAFPCWDEPAKKATFDVTLVVPTFSTAVSNMPVASETPLPNDLKSVRFQVTPKMSTYLVAFAVGEFDFVEGVTGNGVHIRVYTPMGKGHQGSFALSVAVKTLDYLTDYYQIPYPLPKCDMMAIPDFAAGAMENWGLITYRETALLIEEGLSSISTKQRVAYVVAHELAHQWFGNLVTMEWWNNLWLNEGFATFVGTQVVDKLFPQWDTWTQFISTDLFHALELDALESSHPIEVDVSSPDEVNEIFDAISYSKGASVIRMLATFLGEDTFRKGLNIYLKNFLYGNAVTTDLWNALSEASGFDVASVMNCWVKRVGYPLLSVQYHPTHIHFSQDRLLTSGKRIEDQPWWMPLLISSDVDHIPKKLEFREKTHTMNHSGGDFWIKVNSGQTGVFRVKYDTHLYEKLGIATKSKTISASDRLGVQNDAFALAQSGHSRTSQALSIALAYVDETNFAVWSDIAMNVGLVTRLWRGEPVIEKLRAYRRALYSAAARRLGWDVKPDEGDLDKKLRALLMRAMVDSWDQPTIIQANEKFDMYNADPKSVPSDLLGSLFVSVMLQRENGFDTLHGVYNKLVMQDQKVLLLGVLGYVKTDTAAEEVLNWAKNSGEVRTQDFYVVLNSVATHHPDTAWTWLCANYAWLETTFSASIMLFSRIISMVITKFASTERLREVEQFFTTHKCGTEMTIKQGLETIRTQTEWLSRDRSDVAQWLESQGF